MNTNQFVVIMVPSSVITFTLTVSAPEHPVLSVLSLLAFGLLVAYLGGEADYWRMRSREFHEFQQSLVDRGIVKYDELWKTKKL